MRLPKGRKDKRTHLVNVTDQYRARIDPQQKTLLRPRYRMTITPNKEVKNNNMRIPQEILEGPTNAGSFIKATNIAGLKHGDTVDFTITGDVKVSTGENKLYSCTVEGHFKQAKLEGQYSLNRTALRILGNALGPETDNWIGARFTAMALPTRNPQTNAQTSTLSILADSVKSSKSK
jgi:hypothetical protein